MTKLKNDLQELKDLHDSGVMSTEAWNVAVMEAVRNDRNPSSDGGGAAATASGGQNEGVPATAPQEPPPPYIQEPQKKGMFLPDSGDGAGQEWKDNLAAPPPQPDPPAPVNTPGMLGSAPALDKLPTASPDKAKKPMFSGRSWTKDGSDCHTGCDACAKFTGDNCYCTSCHKQHVKAAADNAAPVVTPPTIPVHSSATTTDRTPLLQPGNVGRTVRAKVVRAKCKKFALYICNGIIFVGICGGGIWLYFGMPGLI